ncbi:tetratricopeptide repeat protein [Parabacteroides merdae]|uniref:tetratricopeptide repeat protein n=1 Tax=Parabacteroides merdae TaxID=46503 RepID=UPI001896E998|nr:tetratricopeptide repeat protein [Parabacteroides merdae]MDB8901694.1 tetratricopeptide repeat protein [Parabacteroides merdae]MDB8904557.1 tetratricopeptide repeat protein [Parabacteroides merdae]
MKRVLLTVALCVVASASFAQKKVVNEAQSIAKGSNADFGEARTLIKGALENPETKDDAKTWYVAGFIEDQQFNAERAKQILGQQPNEPVMYEALYGILPYFQKAYELDQLPNEKGKVKPKYTKDIKSILSANHIYLFNGGAYYFDKQEYKKAYDFFNQYVEISELPMFAGTQTAEKDSTFMTVQFYAAAAASLAKDSRLAIAALERAKNTPYRQYDVYQYLCYEYGEARTAQDSVMLEKTFEEGMQVFPDSAFFLNNLINTYIYSNRNEKALEMLNVAIQKNPNDANLYNVMGRVYETGLKDYANAEKNFQIALEKDPNLTDALSNIGRIYYNQGVNKLSEANMINDSKKYQEELSMAKDLFKKALPYYKKAHEAEPEKMDNMIALRGIYYNLNMGPELEAIEAEMNK